MSKNGKHHFAIDLDGTLLAYCGWKGEDHFGDPLPGAVEWVKAALADGHEVTVFTTRTNQERVHAALVERGFPSLPVTNVKRPEFSIMIDDRALTFSGPGLWTIPPQDFGRGRWPWWKEESP